MSQTLKKDVLNCIYTSYKHRANGRTRTQRGQTCSKVADILYRLNLIFFKETAGIQETYSLNDKGPTAVGAHSVFHINYIPRYHCYVHNRCAAVLIQWIKPLRLGDLIFLSFNEAHSSWLTLWFCIQLTFKMAYMTAVGYSL